MRTRTSRDLGETGRRLQSPAMAVYLDHAATTPLRPEALEAMLPFLGGTFGNPSSTHAFGRVAREALDDAHERLARSIGADAREIVFTSGGTEANNLALKGAAWAGRARGHRIVTTRRRAPRGRPHPRAPPEVRLRGRRGARSTATAAWTPRRSSGRSPTGRSSSRSCSRTTRSARSSRSPRWREVVRAQARAPVPCRCRPGGAVARPRRRGPRRGPRRAGGAQGRGSEGHRARCGSGAARTSWRSSTAGRRSATGAPARRTWRAPSGWPRRSSCGPRSGATLVPKVRARRDRLADRACSARRRRGGDGPPASSGCPHIASVIARGTDGALDRRGARPRRDRRVDGLGVHDAAPPTSATS